MIFTKADRDNLQAVKTLLVGVAKALTEQTRIAALQKDTNAIYAAIVGDYFKGEPEASVIQCLDKLMQSHAALEKEISGYGEEGKPIGLVNMVANLHKKLGVMGQSVMDASGSDWTQTRALLDLTNKRLLALEKSAKRSATRPAKFRRK